jgi:predicted PurR-regulated permease PerM
MAARETEVETGATEQPGPTEMRDPAMVSEVKKAAIWLGMALAIVGVVVLAQPILLIVGGLVFAVILDGGVRLLGRVLPIGRGWRLAIVTLAGVAFVAWVFYYAGTTLAAQAESLRAVVTEQFNRLMDMAAEFGLIKSGQSMDVANQLMGGVGRLTSALGSAVGAVTSVFMILIIGIFVAMEPKLYDRGVAWMLPMRHRGQFYEIVDHVGFTLRRLMAGRILGMVVEGVGTWLLLLLAGVPMAALLGLLTGLLAFIPNIGALISGLLMVAVGFSAGTETGLWAVAIYFIVQNVDGYLIMPYVARKTVDLAPALVLGAQLIFGALFGILGLFLADPIIATLKVTLQEMSRTRTAKGRNARETSEDVTAGAGVPAGAPRQPAVPSKRRRARPS